MQKWTQSRSEKKCSISWGRLQGKQALVRHFKQSSFSSAYRQIFGVVFCTGSRGQVELILERQNECKKSWIPPPTPPKKNTSPLYQFFYPSSKKEAGMARGKEQSVELSLCYYFYDLYDLSKTSIMTYVLQPVDVCCREEFSSPTSRCYCFPLQLQLR